MRTDDLTLLVNFCKRIQTLSVRVQHSFDGTSPLSQPYYSNNTFISFLTTGLWAATVKPNTLLFIIPSKVSS